GDDTARRLERRERQGIGECADGRCRSGGVERHTAAEQARLTETTEEEIGVGDRRSAAAATVARRPGGGPGTLGADAERACRGAPGDAAPARADRLDIEARHAQRDAVDLALERERGRSVLDE